MPGTAGGNLGLVWGFDAGEDGWGDSYNENHRKLDAIIQLAVVVWGQDTPPVAPALGDSYIVGNTPTGVWAGHGAEIAVFKDEWSFFQPKVGWRAYNRTTNRFFYWKDGGGWAPEKHLYDGDYGDVVVGDAGTTMTLKAPRGQPNGVASLDGGGKVPISQLPPLSLTDVSVVVSQAAQLALTAEEGDVAVRTDQQKSYIHNGGTAGSMADWTELVMGSLTSWPTLAALEGLSLVAGDILYATGPDTLVRLPKGTAGQILAMNSGATAPEWQTGAGGGGLPAATQAEQEAASSTSAAVTPGRQHFHPSAAKFWADVAVAAGVPTISVSYNVTSITDSGAGRLGLTIATDFSSANWVPVISNKVATKYGLSTWTTRTAGFVDLQNVDNTETFVDPAGWSIAGFGDQ